MKVFVLLAASDYEECDAEDCSCLVLEVVGAVTNEEAAKKWEKSLGFYNKYKEINVDDSELLNKIAKEETR